ncbi:hypothetical protein Ancab_005375 [Ancistrocladus abbreviatus]
MFVCMTAAVELAGENEIKAIIGMEKWQEAALVAQIGSQYQLPILSLATAPATLPSAPQRWPSLVQMAGNYSHQITCIADIVKYYNWRKVIAVYEDDGYAGTSVMLDLLAQALQENGAEIEYRLAFPPVASMNDPTKIVLEELTKVFSMQSRMFIVLQSSLPLAVHLFREARNSGLIGRDTAWIITDSISSLLDSVNSTVISSMEGVLGIKTHYSETSREFKFFYYQFWKEFRAAYPEEWNSQPGIHALQAFDAIIAITIAIEHLGAETGSSTKLLETILSSKFDGLSSKISFQGGELSCNPVFRVINVVGKGHKELDFWSAENHFFERLGDETGRRVVTWPGDTNEVPKGWTLPTNAKPLRIGVPGNASFEKSVRVDKDNNSNRTEYSGYSIDVFLEVVRIIEENYALPYEFVAFYGTYDELVNCVYNKTFDAVVGDVTILANRSKHVDFTQPYAKSGLSMIVPYKSKESRKARLFTKPFNMQLWLATGGVLLYTTFSVWFLEHNVNPDFGGTWKNQLSASLRFIFSSVFFAHEERILSNYTRIVVVVWLFVVFILTQSYTANLTSMLTVPLLKPKIEDIGWLKANDKQVGCDGESFVRVYLTDVLGFEAKNIRNVSSQYYYPDLLNNGTIAAAFLELPFEKVFLDEYCGTFTHTNFTLRFGGLGFVFPKGSPLVADVSKAILKLSENGVLQQLEGKWFSPPLDCALSNTNTDVESLNIQVFWVLYLFSGATSLTCFLLFFIRLLKSYRAQESKIGNGGSLGEKLVKLWKYFDKGETRNGNEATPISDELDGLGPPQWDISSSSESEITEHPQASLSFEVQTSPTPHA